MKKFLFLLAGLIFHSTSVADATKGKEYFSSLNGGQCYSCHRADGRKVVGPGLKGVSKRHTDEWLTAFLTDPQKTWTSDHPETVELKKRVRKTRAPRSVCKKNPMNEEELKNLLDYLKTL